MSKETEVRYWPLARYVKALGFDVVNTEHITVWEHNCEEGILEASFRINSLRDLTRLDLNRWGRGEVSAILRRWDQTDLFVPGECHTKDKFRELLDEIPDTTLLEVESYLILHTDLARRVDLLRPAYWEEIVCVLCDGHPRFIGEGGIPQPWLPWFVEMIVQFDVSVERGRFIYGYLEDQVPRLKFLSRRGISEAALYWDDEQTLIFAAPEDSLGAALPWLCQRETPFDEIEALLKTNARSPACLVSWYAPDWEY